MTTQKHLKTRVRDRMRRTGETYTTARRIVLAAGPSSTGEPAVDGGPDLAGSTPEATTLRVLLAHAGAVAPHTGRPWTEAMLLGLTGGVGVSVHAFRYERDDVSTFFVGARRPDTADAMVSGLKRLGIAHTVSETGGARAAAQRLRSDLEEHGAVAAWVDAATLGTRGMPTSWQGGAYHVLTVLGLDDDHSTASLADLTDAPVVVDREVLDAARARIRKQRRRLLAVTGPQPDDVALEPAVRHAVRACHARLTDERSRAVRIDALDDLADRMHGSARKDGWAQVFPRGRHLWTALTSLHHFVEHYFTGGGLSRPLYADFLREAASATGIRDLDAAAERYEEIGRHWTALAAAALPDEVDLLAQARSLHDELAARYAEAGPDAVERLTDIWQRLDDLAEEAAHAFPLDAERTEQLCADLAHRTRMIADAERAAVELLARIADG